MPAASTSHFVVLAALVGVLGCPLDPGHLTAPPWEADIVGTVSVVDEFPAGDGPRLPQRERDLTAAQHIVTGATLDAEAIVAGMEALTSAYRRIGIEVSPVFQSSSRDERTIDLTFVVFPASPPEHPYYTFGDETIPCGDDPPPRDIERGRNHYSLDSAREVAPRGALNVRLR